MLARSRNKQTGSDKVLEQRVEHGSNGHVHTAFMAVGSMAIVENLRFFLEVVDLRGLLNVQSKKLEEQPKRHMRLIESRSMDCKHSVKSRSWCSYQ